MKFKKILLAILGAHCALSPFLTNTQLQASWFRLSAFTGQLTPTTAHAASAVTEQVAQTTASIVTPTISETAKEITKGFGQWIAQAPSATQSLVYNGLAFTGNNIKAAGSWTGQQAKGFGQSILNAPFALEELGVQGLNKLSFNVNPGAIYTYLKNNPKWIGAACIAGLASYIYLKSWNDSQKSLISALHGNLDYDIDHIKDIHKILLQVRGVAASAIPALSYVPAKETDALKKAGKIETLPFKADKKITGLVQEFYAEAKRILTAAQTTRTIADLKDLEGIKHRIIKHFSSPLPL